MVDRGRAGDSAVEGQSGGADNPIGHTGLTTSAPDLTGGSQVTGQPGQFDLLFDENVLATGVVPNRVAVYRDDGAPG